MAKLVQACKSEEKSLRIPTQASSANIEQALLEADAAPDEGPFSPPPPPSNLRHLGGGGEGALSQLLVTWAQTTCWRRITTLS